MLPTRILKSVFLWIGIFTFIVLFYATQYFTVDDTKSKHFLSLFKKTDADNFTKTHLTNGIPRIIHQTWKTDDIPSRWIMTQQTWKMQSIAVSPTKLRLPHLEFKYYFWNDTTLENFVAEKFPWFLSTYLSYPYGIQRADAGRYLLLYHYGGIYVDLDVGCAPGGVMQLLKSLTGEEGVVLFQTEPYGFTNDIIVSKRQHPFMRHIIAALADSNRNYLLPYLTVMFSTGPVFFSKCFSSYVHKKEIFTLPMTSYERVYIYHVGGGSWHYLDAKIIWWLFDNVSPYSFLFIIVCLVMVFIMCKCYKRQDEDR